MNVSPYNSLRSVPLLKRELQIYDECSLFKNMPLAVPFPAAQTWLNHQDDGSDEPLLVCRHRTVGFQAFASLDIYYLLMALKSSSWEWFLFPKYTFLQRPRISCSGFLHCTCEGYRGFKYLDVERTVSLWPTEQDRQTLGKVSE